MTGQAKGYDPIFGDMDMSRAVDPVFGTYAATPEQMEARQISTQVVEQALTPEQQAIRDRIARQSLAYMLSSYYGNPDGKDNEVDQVLKSVINNSESLDSGLEEALTILVKAGQQHGVFTQESQLGDVAAGLVDRLAIGAAGASGMDAEELMNSIRQGIGGMGVNDSENKLLQSVAGSREIYDKLLANSSDLDIQRKKAANMGYSEFRRDRSLFELDMLRAGNSNSGQYVNGYGSIGSVKFFV
jgi:hypothetical protein